MVVFYRGKKGRFISAKSAKRRKPENVLTELRKTVRGKSLRLVRGYHPRLRLPIKKKKITFAPPIRPKPESKPKPKVMVTPIEEEDIGEEPDDFKEGEEYVYEPEHPTRDAELFEGEPEDVEDWLDFSSGDDDFDKFLEELNRLDNIFDYPEEDSWYE